MKRVPLGAKEARPVWEPVQGIGREVTAAQTRASMKEVVRNDPILTFLKVQPHVQ